MRVLLDTHILLYWIADPDRLSPAQSHAVAAISPKNPAIVADISLWEIAMLATSGRIQLNVPIRDWLSKATAPPLVQIAEISPNVAATVGNLADWDHQDPADRLIISTAQVFGAVLLTNDTIIRDSGLVEVL